MAALLPAALTQVVDTALLQASYGLELAEAHDMQRQPAHA